MAPASQAWQTFADAVLRREAMRCRTAGGIPPRDVAGLYVDDAEVDRILSSLPGLDGAPVAVVASLEQVVDPWLAGIRKRFHAALDDAGAFSVLVGAARLDSAEAEVLAVVAAVEVDQQRQRLMAYVQDSVHLPQVALGTMSRLFPWEHPGACTVAPASRLLRSALIDVADDGPWAGRMVSLSPRVVWALSGDDSSDPGLPFGAARIDQPDLPEEGADLLLVPGGDRMTRLATAMAACAGTTFLAVRAPTTAAGWRAVVREATVGQRAVVLELPAGLSDEGRQVVSTCDHLVWALCSERELPLETLPDRPWRELTADERDPPGSTAMREGGHLLSAEQEHLLARATVSLAGDDRAAVRRLAGGQLDGLAVRIRPRRSWDDLVLPPDQHLQLRELAARYRHRGTVYRRWGFVPVPSAGLVAAFAGPSGTGKTLAAEVVAGDLGLDVYKVDLSAVVSKYIGETEKNLEQIFSAASSGNVLLFFDEADALFGKRSEVGDAHDRYANMEVSYLLQRLETYDGAVVLATNLQGNMDAAFLRRIHMTVEFPLPDEEQRRAIWERAFPASCPHEGIDVAFLAAQFKLSGGSIRNVSLGAAFLAAQAGTSVTMDLVVLALKREFQKLGRLRTEAEFERYFDLVMR